MPACFQLFRKTDPLTAVPLAKIDEEICAAVGDPVDPVKYCRMWFDIIGFQLAIGKSFAEVREHLVKYNWPTLLPVLDYIEANFDANSWTQIGRR